MKNSIVDKANWREEFEVFLSQYRDFVVGPPPPLTAIKNMIQEIQMFFFYKKKIKKIILI
jgi:hypothetical protein